MTDKKIFAELEDFARDLEAFAKSLARLAETNAPDTLQDRAAKPESADKEGENDE
jgi:hypothetical protein